MTPAPIPGVGAGINLRPRVAALGGGHGLSASLQALQLVTDRITAIVTVADDGGSSGRLREEFDILPPGDLRMALAALCDTTEWGQQWADALQHRFAGDGPLGGHALGNLIIASLWDLLGDPVAGLDQGQRARLQDLQCHPGHGVTARNCTQRPGVSSAGSSRSTSHMANSV